MGISRISEELPEPVLRSHVILVLHEKQLHGKLDRYLSAAYVALFEYRMDLSEAARYVQIFGQSVPIQV